MYGKEPTPRQTLALLLGASEFPNAPTFAHGEAFYHSAYDFRQYLLNDLGLPRENVAWFFDDSRSPSDQLLKIGDFLETSSRELASQGMSAQDLIIHYVGHGLFTGGEQSYCFAVR